MVAAAAAAAASLVAAVGLKPEIKSNKTSVLCNVLRWGGA
jgi:hypothetical protein